MKGHKGGRAIRNLGHILLILAAISIWLVPLWWTVITAIRPVSETLSLTPQWITHRPTWENFKRAFNLAPWGRYYLNTFQVVVGTFLLQMIIIIPAAYAFARLTFPGRDLLFYVLLVQLMLPAAALIFPNYTTIKTLGLVDTKVALMLPYAASAFGTFLLRQAFRTVPQELEDAALIDGCNWLGLIRHVYLPLIKPVFIAFALNSIIYHWNEFLWPLVVINSPSKRTLTLGLAMAFKSQETGFDWPLMTATLLIVISPLLMLFVVFQRWFIRIYAQSGIKG